MLDISGEIIDGRYQLEALIAAGGMASIYKATDLRLDRLVAVKIMHPHLANDEEFVQRFIREAKATAAISHPNVVAITDQGWNTGGSPAVFIVMEYIDGFTLRDLLNEKGHLTPSEVLAYMTPVVSALSQAHSLHITHRDLKPENVLISKDGRIKVADFGLARSAHLGATLTVESSIILGSVSYLSPEQVQRGVSDARSDIYSLGIVFFELLTGKRPFEGDSPIAIAYKHVNETVPAPSTLLSDIPSVFDSLVIKATASNPDQRFKNATEMLSELQDISLALNPKKAQLSLELDLPISAISKPQTRPKRRDRYEVRIGNSPVIDSLKERTAPPPLSEKASSTMNTTSGVRRKSSRKVRRNRWITLILLIALATGGWYEFFGPGSGISIPSVAGLTVKDATSSLYALGLNVNISSDTFSTSVPKGLVISSYPGGGGHLKKGDTVELVVSKGAQYTAQPTPDSAPNPSASTTQSASPIPSSSTTPTPVATTTPSTSNLISIPSYIGLSGDQAQNELTAAGFVVNSTFGFSDSVPAGMVISQSPNSPASAPLGSTIRIVVSQGSSKVFVPNVVTLSQSAATTALENIQLTVKIKRMKGATSGGVVISQSPAAGTSVSRNSTVTITLK